MAKRPRLGRGLDGLLPPAPPKAAPAAPKPKGRGAYQTAHESGAIFYKDADPRTAHFMQFRVRLPPSLRCEIDERPPLDLKLLAVNDSGERVVVV